MMLFLIGTVIVGTGIVALAVKIGKGLKVLGRPYPLPPAKRIDVDPVHQAQQIAELEKQFTGGGV
jgi:hypothetical protein